MNKALLDIFVEYSDDGMELNYSETVDWQVRAKKSLIIVGGNILSRGLTINGLSVTFLAGHQVKK